MSYNRRGYWNRGNASTTARAVAQLNGQAASPTLAMSAAPAGTVYQNEGGNSVVIGYTAKGEQMRVGVNEFKGKNYLGIRLYFDASGQGDWAPSKQGVSLPSGQDWNLLADACRHLLLLVESQQTPAQR